MSEQSPSDKPNIEIEPRGDYLYVRLTGTLETMLAMHTYHSGISAAMTPELSGRVLYDNREASPAPEEIRAELWTWMTTTTVVRRAAVVAHGARITRRVERTADLNRIVVKGFHSIEEAEEWLRRGT